MLDTHIAIWAVLDFEALTTGERKLISEADGPVVLSAVAVWEARLKWHSLHVSGDRKGPVDPAVLVRFATVMDWELLPLSSRHAATTLDHPVPHKDPFDELLLVQAQVEGMRLLSRDTKLTSHPLAVSG